MDARQLEVNMQSLLAFKSQGHGLYHEHNTMSCFRMCSCSCATGSHALYHVRVDTVSGRLASRSARPMATISMGSPRAVPVPCASA